MTIKITVGDKAPNFTLPDTDQKIRSLKEFRGRKVVIAFYVSAFTNVCTKEMCAFRDATDRLVHLKAQIIGIKSRNDPFSNKEFKEKNKLPFPILSDYNHRTIRAYGNRKPQFRRTQRLHSCQTIHLHSRQKRNSSLHLEHRHTNKRT